jgi:hypothetical protein
MIYLVFGSENDSFWYTITASNSWEHFINETIKISNKYDKTIDIQKGTFIILHDLSSTNIGGYIDHPLFLAAEFQMLAIPS